jgi:hypothetical protein
MFKGRGWLYFNRGSDGVYLGVFYITMMGMFSLLVRIWSYVYLKRYHSFVIFVYLNYICGIVQVYLVISLSFQCIVFLVQHVANVHNKQILIQ